MTVPAGSGLHFLFKVTWKSSGTKNRWTKLKTGAIQDKLHTGYASAKMRVQPYRPWSIYLRLNACGMIKRNGIE